MKKNNFTKQKLIDLLIKKAMGFYYTESQLEFEKTKKSAVKGDEVGKNNNLYSKIDTNSLQKDNGVLANQLSFFSKTATREEVEERELIKNSKKNSKNGKNAKKTAIRAKTESQSLSEIDGFCVVSPEFSEVFIKDDETCKADAKVKNDFSNLKKSSDRVYSNDSDVNDKIDLSDKTLEPEELTLVKKKVATHFVAPDMIAIKILFEIFDKKVEDDDLDKISDEELINLKTKLLEELKDEDF